MELESIGLNSIADRIKLIIAYYHMNNRSFAIKCGIKQNTFYNQIIGLREISLWTVHAILISNQEISAEWLLRGKGEMVLSNSTIKDVASVDLDNMQQSLLKQSELIKEIEKNNKRLLELLQIND